MRPKFRTTALSLLAMTLLLFAAGAALAQEDNVPKKKLRPNSTVSSTIGGESHDGYVIKLRKGQRMSVAITWKKEDNNRAEFTVSRSDKFYGAEMVKFGQTTYNEDKWNGKIPEAGDYYIYVVAHPTATYTLKVTVK